MIRDKYKLRELFQKEKDKRIRQSQEKRQRIKNIKKEEKIRKIKHIKCLQKIEKIERERLEKKKYIEERIIIFKTTKYVEEFPITEERLYSTREELKEAEKREHLMTCTSCRVEIRI